MTLKNAFARMRPLVFVVSLPGVAGCIQPPPIPDMRGAYVVSGDASVTVPFTFDDNRMFVDISFVEPDGSLHKALAFVNQGSGAFVLTNKLYRDLGIGDGNALRVEIGKMNIAVDPRAVQPEDMANSFTLQLNPFRKPQTAAEAAKGPGGSTAALAAPMNVEAVIPPGLLENFQTVFDYGAKTLTLAASGTLKPDGVAIPMRVNPRTGFAMLDVIVDGKIYPAVIDNGGSYSAFRSDVLSGWTARHPDWLRSEGGIGESNLTMDVGFDVGAPVVKAQAVALGPLKLDELGVIAPVMSGALGLLITRTFQNYYSDKAGEDVNGWIGGNVMKSFRITLDYPNRTSYWFRETPLDTNDLDQVGVTLARWNGMTGIAGIAKKNGIETVRGAMSGDQIVSIDGHRTAAMTRGELLNALHGAPGDSHKLLLKRDGKEINVDAPVTRF